MKKSIRKITAQTLLLTLILFLLSCSSLSTNEESTDESNIVQETINQLVIDNEIPGLNFSMIDEQARIHNYSAGYTDTETKELMTINNSMFSGSIGKTYAVAILMQLVEDGKVELDKKYIDYFPEVEWLNLLPNMDDITVEMLLQHISGLPRYVLNPGVWEAVKNDPDKVWSYKDRLSFIFNEEAVHEAGKGWAYSDTNYLLIGMLIEKITHSDYYQEVVNRLLKSNNLNHTYPAIKREFEKLSMGYSADEMFGVNGKVVKNGQFIFNPQMEWTGGGMVSTTSDLARWAKLYYEAKVFSNESLNKIVNPTLMGTDLTKNLSYGMGSFIYITNLGIAYGHTGTMPGYNSIFAYFPDKKMAIAMQINCDYAGKKMGLITYVEKILSNLIEADNNN